MSVVASCKSQAWPERIFSAFLRFRIAKLSSEFQNIVETGCYHQAGLVKSAEQLTPSEPDAGSSAPDGNI